jgi:hypothetical protein
MLLTVILSFVRLAASWLDIFHGTDIIVQIFSVPVLETSPFSVPVLSQSEPIGSGSTSQTPEPNRFGSGAPSHP